jgi:hypothetical protein
MSETEMRCRRHRTFGARINVDEYTNFTGEFIDLVRETNIPEAKTMCDRVLNATSQRTVQAAIRSLDRNMIQGRIDRIRSLLSNIFSILLDADMDARTNIDQVRLDTLRGNFQRVRNGFDVFFPKVFHDLPNEILAAWTSRNFNDATVNFAPRYLDLTAVDQAVTLVHERAHTVLRINGHPGTGDSPICIVPHEGKKGLGFDDAIRNAYCYEWMAISLHPLYNPMPYRDACGPVIGSRSHP